MESPNQSHHQHELPPKARRVVCIIYIAMAVMILLPFLLVWLTGAISLGGS
jgi:hypothetical protein